MNEKLKNYELELGEMTRRLLLNGKLKNSFLCVTLRGNESMELQIHHLMLNQNSISQKNPLNHIRFEKQRSKGR